MTDIEKYTNTTHQLTKVNTERKYTILTKIAFKLKQQNTEYYINNEIYVFIHYYDNNSLFNFRSGRNKKYRTNCTNIAHYIS